MSVIWTELGKQGRVVIPAALRRELGWEEGTRLAARIKDGAVELITREAAGRRLKEMFADVPVSLSEELMAERRAEAAAEAAEELAELERRARRP